MPDGSHADIPTEEIFTFVGAWDHYQAMPGLVGVIRYRLREDPADAPYPYIGDFALPRGTDGSFYDPEDRTLYWFRQETFDLWRFWKTG